MEPEYKPSYRAQLIKRFGSRIPTTAEGIPTGYYRVDFLPPEPIQAPSGTNTSGPYNGAEPGDQPSIHLGSTPNDSPHNGAEPIEVDGISVSVGFSAKAKAMSSPQAAGTQVATEDDIAYALRSAFVELTFDHGYPALPNGMPFWHKLDFEAGFSFAAFQIYLELGTNGPRELYTLASHPELLEVASRHLAGVPATPASLLIVLQEYFILHYWAARAKAFDLYKEAAWRHQRLRRQVKTEDSHFDIADRLMKKLSTYFESEAFEKDLTPRVAVDALSKVVAIQRVSLGLPAGGPLPANQQPEATSFEMIMRNVATTQGAGVTRQNHGAASHTKEMLDQVLLDPVAAGNLQEVIIRISGMMVQGQDVSSNERRFPSRHREEIVDIQEAEFVDVSKIDVPR